MSVSIYLKTMSGDLFPLEVAPSASLEEVAEQASASHPEPFPPGRTKVLSMEDSKEREEGEMLLAMVLDAPVMERGVYPQGGQPYTRWNVTLRGKTYYLYISKYWKCPRSGTIHPQYAISRKEEVTKPSETHGSPCADLWDVVKDYVPDVTPKEMKGLREMVEPHLDQMAEEKDWVILHYFSKDEPVECGCGSVVKHSGLKAHEKSKKHQVWVKTQE